MNAHKGILSVGKESGRLCRDVRVKIERVERGPNGIRGCGKDSDIYVRNGLRWACITTSSVY
jgi:hypothetical protein